MIVNRVKIAILNAKKLSIGKLGDNNKNLNFCIFYGERLNGTLLTQRWI